MAASLQLHANAHNKTVVTNQALSDGKTVTLVCKSRYRYLYWACASAT